MNRIYLNEDWYYTDSFTNKLLEMPVLVTEYEKIRIPHTTAVTPLHYYDEKLYQKNAGYVRELFIEKAWEGKTLLLTFEGAAHKAVVYINGKKVKEHACGYTAFTVDLTGHVTYGESNTIVVELDSREDLNVPPFGFVIDYQTYGGIYRDVYLEVLNNRYLEDVFVKTLDVCHEPKLSVDIKVSEQLSGNEKIRISLLEENEPGSSNDGRESHDKKTIACKDYTGIEQENSFCLDQLSNIRLWDTEHPILYQVCVQLFDGEELLDEKWIRTGFREVKFSKDGFFLNGKKLKLRGLNRHQSYPYVGYAMPKNPQRADADILKKELGCNAVRTSHYPQSHYFLERCDEIGLLVFTEMPGWQHIGNEEWKLQAIENVKEMVIQYRNHPSIFLWGVRINESPDDDDFYRRTNEVARALDHTRQTSGVRCIANSNLLEDVYAYNDFYHDGTGAGVSLKKKITSDMEKGYFISEHNGHMFPTKSYDSEAHRTSQVLRHAKVLDDYYGEEDIAACFGWCMFDYNTHKDFGSGDRICYHGVMDMFRNKKPAGHLYASQDTQIPVLEITSDMDIGESPACLVQDIYAITNADSVKLYKNDVFVREFTSKDTPFANMPHGPILIDDLIGDAMMEKEGFSKAKSEDVKSVLMSACKNGMNHLPVKTMLTAAKCVLFRGMKLQDAVDLYQKYIGNWGGTATTYRFDAIMDGKVVASTTKKPANQVTILADVDHTTLCEENSYDVAGIRLKALSEEANVLHFYQEPVTLETVGPIEIIGPKVISFQGGMTGTYVKTLGESGQASLIIHSEQAEDVKIDFIVEKS